MLTNKDYFIFALGAAVGAVASYFYTKKKMEKEFFEETYATEHPEKDGEGRRGKDVVVTDTTGNFEATRKEAEERRQRAKDIAAENGYDSAVEEHEGPYIISEEDYAIGVLGYTNERINWYPHMGRATNEVDDEEVDAKELCGMSNLIEIEKSETNYGYIRDDEHMKDIEVYVCMADWPLEDDEGGVKD